MASDKTSAKEGLSARAAIALVLKRSGKPLKAREIATRVIDGGLAPGLHGITPDATIFSILAVEHVREGLFERTTPGTYRLRQASKPKASKPRGKVAA